ncbi:MAG: fibronectin type III-like domain-contianing protein, partial [Bacteroidales bacterium]|nr:fibronectin type III-like domain-contianing protein [Bacteroidales bacterium]
AYDPESDIAEYKEGIYVGYRWAEKMQTEPLFAFGHGLSYTDFEYGEAVCPRKTVRQGADVTVSVDVTNAGKVAGKEVVQLYIGDDNSSVDRPVKELKGFRKIALEPGETQTVTFTVTPDMLKYYDSSAGGWVLEPGTFTAYVGSSSADIRTSVRFEIK